MRDIARFLAGEREEYPAIPVDYFDDDDGRSASNFEERARPQRKPELAAELPGLTLRPDVPAGGAATMIFRNWLEFLGADARTLSSEAFESGDTHGQSVVRVAGACLQSPVPASPRNAPCPVREGADGEFHLRRYPG